MHIDPEWSDAFNALIMGEKWWVSLPKDLYEFKDEFSCIDLRLVLQKNDLLRMRY